MGIITLISDWGNSDYYTAAVKGMILSHIPDTQIIDITHEVTPFNSNEAAYILKNAYKNFPDGTVHIIGINTEESMNHPHTVAFYDKHYFIGTDEGIFSLIFDDDPDQVIELEIVQDTENFTFSSRDRFVKAAVHLIKGEPLEKLGSPKKEIKKKLLFEPIVDPNYIRGVIVHVDSYENLITNIPKSLFEKVVGKKKFSITFRSDSVSKISDSYGDVRPGEVVALFGSNNMLEIAINQANAASLLGMDLNHTVFVNIE